MMVGKSGDNIRNRLLHVRAQIAAAAERCGRIPGEIHLVVVTKSKPLDIVQEVVEAGASILGENYPEEALSKISALSETGVEWHMIGHVQSRKAEKVVQYFSMLHSLDSVKLAERLNRYCIQYDRKLAVLLEVNISGETGKFGFPAWDERRWFELEPIFLQISAFPQLMVHGLMTMPPFFEEAEGSRPYFQKLHRLQRFLKEKVPQVDWYDLSMGTSADYITAIEEGATYVRVGQAIIGPRPE
jgi:pyridoxal phosphate enzyme (YggS family)